MKTKLFAAVLIPAAFSLFALSGCEMPEIAFYYALTVNPSKTAVKVGETIDIALTYENIFRRDICIELTEEATFHNYGLKDILYYQVLPKNEQPNWVLEDIGIDIDQRTKKTIEKDAIISRTVKHTFDKLGNYAIHLAMFYYLDGENKMTDIYSQPVQIKVRLL
jgi:hypothetical protein